MNHTPSSSVNVSTCDKSSTSIHSTPCSDDDEMSFYELLCDLSGIDEDILLANHGYLRDKTICNTLQGQIFEAKIINNKHQQNKPILNAQRVLIKKTDKTLYEKRIAIQDIVKEAAILKYLSVDNHSMGDSIIKYIDFFESQSDYFLVMQYIENSINLKDFVKKCHQYIQEKQLGIKQYQKFIKYILWQLSVALDWIHNDMHCCNLNICIENIILKDAEFKRGSNGKININSNISVKLVDFGCSEIFNDDTFKCNKYALSINNEQYLAANIYDPYDARSVDIWCLGMIFYESLIGQKPYERIPDNIDTIKPGTGYWAIYKEKLNIYFKMHTLSKYINKKDGTMILLMGLLKIDETKRLNTMQILKNKYFKSYYNSYRQRIEENRDLQREQIFIQQNKMYHLNTKKV